MQRCPPPPMLPLPFPVLIIAGAEWPTAPRYRLRMPMWWDMDILGHGQQRKSQK